ncbi:MAG: hypothetical protein ACLSGI_11245 [Butyricicoccaceae bacterium]
MILQHAGQLSVRPNGQLPLGNGGWTVKPLSCNLVLLRERLPGERARISRSLMICSAPDCTLEISNRSLVDFEP